MHIIMKAKKALLDSKLNTRKWANMQCAYSWKKSPDSKKKKRKIVGYYDRTEVLGLRELGERYSCQSLELYYSGSDQKLFVWVSWKKKKLKNWTFFYKKKKKKEIFNFRSVLIHRQARLNILLLYKVCYEGWEYFSMLHAGISV